MECEIVRQALLERSLSELDELTPHFARCPRCAERLARVRQAEEAIATSLDAFAQGGDFEAAFARAAGTQAVALEPRSTLSYRSVLTVLTLAAVALTTFVVSTVPSEESPAGETVWAPEPLPVPSEDTGESPLPVEPVVPIELPQAPAPAAPLSLEVPVVPEPPAAPEPQQASLPAPAPPPDCGELDVIELQEKAIGGTLNGEHIRCIEHALETRSHHDRLGLMSALAIDAKIRKDEATAKRWFAEINVEMLSDTEGTYRRVMIKPGDTVTEHKAVLEMAERALEQSRSLQGKTLDKRLLELYRVRAEGSAWLWKNVTDTAEAEKYHAQARQFAQEWHAYAISVGRDERAARALCERTGGSCTR
jgi:hypothetical protein